jgi:hypothetical protein
MIALLSSLSLSSSFFVACGDDSDSSTTASQATAATTMEPEYIVPGGAGLSERQREMVSMVEAYVAAWQATDGHGVASFMTADGYIEYRHDNTIYRVSDGTLQERVANRPYDTPDRCPDDRLRQLDCSVGQDRFNEAELVVGRAVHPKR